MSYAQNTSVPVSRSLSEIDLLLTKYGASEFGFHRKGDEVIISFRIADVDVRMTVTMPPKSDYAYTDSGRTRTLNQMLNAWEQACRQKWRVLLLGIKAKLAMVDEGVTTIEREFMADVVVPGQDFTFSQLLTMIEEGSAPRIIELPMSLDNDDADWREITDEGE